jgi:hypothetical protein
MSDNNPLLPHPRVVMGTGRGFCRLVGFYQQYKTQRSYLALNSQPRDHFFELLWESCRESRNNLLSCDAIHWRQQPTELDGNRLIREYTGRNSFDTIRANVPRCLSCYEQSEACSVLRIAPVKVVLAAIQRYNPFEAAAD